MTAVTRPAGRTQFPSTSVTIAVDRVPITLDRTAAIAVQECADLLTVLDADGIVRYVSGSVRHLLGLTPGQVIGRSMCELVAAEDRRNFAAWTAHAWCGTAPPELSHRMSRADGGLEWFETRIRCANTGAERNLVVASREARERAALDRRLASLLRLWEQVGDAMHDGVIVLNDDYTIIDANRGAGKLLRLPPSALRGIPLSDIATVDDLDDEPGRGRTPGSRTVVLTSERPDRPFVLTASAHTRARNDDDRAARVILVLDAHSSSSAPPRAVGERVGRLSRREAEVLRFLADGLDVHTIAAQLEISIHTVRAYVKSILKKLDARNQLQAVVIGLREHLLELS